MLKTLEIGYCCCHTDTLKEVEGVQLDGCLLILHPCSCGQLTLMYQDDNVDNDDDVLQPVSQPLPAAHGGGRGLDVSASGVRRQRRDLRNLLPYEEQMMSYNAAQGGGGSNDLYYQSDDLRGRGLNQALQQLVERDQRREQEEGERAG